MSTGVPKKEVLLQNGEKHKVIIHRAPQRLKAYIQWGVVWFHKGIINDTAISTPVPCSPQHNTIYGKQIWLSWKWFLQWQKSGEEPKCQLCGLIPVCWKQPQKVKISVLKRMIMKDWNPRHQDSWIAHRYTLGLVEPQYLMSPKTELGQVLFSLIILVIYTAGVEAAPNMHLISRVLVYNIKLNLYTNTL